MKEVISMTFYKATDTDGRSFHEPHLLWKIGKATRHPSKLPMVANDASTYLSASSEPADCTGFSWPCRFFEVEAIGKTLTGMDYPNKVAAKAFRVVRELPAYQALGPNGAAVAAFIERCRRLRADEAKRLGAAWVAAEVAAWDAARVAAGGAAGGAAGVAIWVAAVAIVVKDKITQEQFDTLTKPWRDAGLELA